MQPVKILIFSDSHGKAHRVRKVLEMHRDADMVFFLGDGMGEAELYTKEFGLRLVPVLGNCDSYTGLYSYVREEETVSLEGHRIFLAHGHRFDVKYGSSHIAAEAKKRGCDIVIYGHTHVPYSVYRPEPQGPIHIFNPGSLGEPRHGNPSYGLLILQGNSVLFSHGEVP